MSTEKSRPLLSPEEIAVRAGEQVQFLRLPDPRSVFAERESRLRTLAIGHPIGEYLSFIADVAQAQHQVASAYPGLALPDDQWLNDSADEVAPPFRPTQWARQSEWIDGLRDMVAILEGNVQQPPVKALLKQLRNAPAKHLDTQADRILNGITLGLNVAAAPLIAAALQVYWSCLVAQTAALYGEQAFGRIAVNTACPCCGSAPTASITRIGAELSGFRYLHCSLCSAQWHLVRVKCAHCESTKGIHYQELQLDAGDGEGNASDPVPGNGRGARSAAVKAECCDECGHYLKIAYMDKDAHVEPVADDLATISLDLLVTQSGKQPAGVNLMIWYGEPNTQ